MAAIHDLGIVLRRLDYSETSQVLAVFTREHGQQRLIARGIKRSTKTRVAVGIDLLELGTVVYLRRPGKEDNLGTLTEWRQREIFPHLRIDLARCYAAQYAADVTVQLTEVHDPHARLFDGLVGLFAGLSTRAPLPALVSYLWLLLSEIGLRPELNRCVSCGRDVEGDAILYFSSREGGAVCRDCEPSTIEKRRIEPSALRLLSAEPRADGRLSESALEPVDRGTTAAYQLLEYHLTQTLNRPPRLAEALRQAIDLPRR